MQYESNSVDEYLKAIPEDRCEVLTKIRKLLSDNIPRGFEETLGYGMPAYVVPHLIYPNGYHCNPKLPLPFIIWVFMQVKNSLNGLFQIILNIAVQNWTWEKVVFDLKK